jgi:glycosyltransferase involved in cell wall biosynthesis
MPEVARNAAIYFDPYSIDAIAESIEQVLDSERRTSMIRRGFAQAKKFSWNQSAFRTAEIYAAVSGTRMRAAA